MQVHQNVSISFYRKRKKGDKEGYIPIYCRITIDGLEGERTTGVKILDHQWNSNAKQVLATNSFYKAYNKKLGQMRTDLERHFDFIVAKNGIATPALVFASYKTPLNGKHKKLKKNITQLFIVDLDDLIKKYIRYNRQVDSLEKFGGAQQLKSEWQLVLHIF